MRLWDTELPPKKRSLESLWFSATRFLSRSLTVLSRGTALSVVNTFRVSHWLSVWFTASAMRCFNNFIGLTHVVLRFIKGPRFGVPMIG